MSPTLKRILLIVGLIIVSILIAFGLYYMFKRSQDSRVVPPAPPGQLPPGQLPPAGERPPGEVGLPPTQVETGLPPSGAVPGAEPPVFRREPVERITTSFATNPSLSTAGNYRYHDANNGRFYRLGRDGNVVSLSDKVFFNVQDVTWARSADKAVIAYPDGSKTIYNFDTETQSTLPSHWEDFSFSPDSSEIVAKSLGLAPENRWLVVTSDTANGARLIEPLGNNADKVTIDWSPSRQAVAFSETGRPLGLDRREVLFVGLEGENFKSITVEGLNFLPEWSPTGRRLLYSVDSARSGFKPELWVVDSFGERIGGNRKTVGLNTWADKCAFGDDNTLFCAVPRDLPVGAAMAREISLQSYDDLFKIDLTSGLRTNIPFGDYTVEDLSYDPVANTVFFTDTVRTGVFEVNL
jgi:hypothetical protein